VVKADPEEYSRGGLGVFCAQLALAPFSNPFWATGTPSLKSVSGPLIRWSSSIAPLGASSLFDKLLLALI
jgi:hypothetical protein